MKLQLYTFLRNYNLLEIIGAYNRAYESYGEAGFLTPKQMKAVQQYLKFRVIGTEEENTLPKLLVYDADNPNTFDLFEKDEADGCYYFYNERKILPCATKEEATVIEEMLQNGDFDLFMNDDEKHLLRHNLDRYFTAPKGVNKQKRINLRQYIDTIGVSATGDDLQAIQPLKATIDRAVKSSSFVRFRYAKTGAPEENSATEYTVWPLGYCYSQIEHRLKLRAIDAHNGISNYYLAYMSDLCSISSEEAGFMPDLDKRPAKGELVFSFDNSQRGIDERVAARFSDYHKIVEYNRDTNRIRYRVYYDKAETRRIQARLLSLGRYVTVESKEKSKIKKRAEKALAQYRI